MLHYGYLRVIVVNMLFFVIGTKQGVPYLYFLKEESLQQVFIFQFFFREIDGYRCKSNRINRGCSRVQITSTKLNHAFFFFSTNFFASKASINIKQIVGFLGFFLASFLGTASNTPNFKANLTKKFKFHILAPLSTWKNCKNYETLLYSMACP